MSAVLSLGHCERIAVRLSIGDEEIVSAICILDLDEIK